MCNCNSSKELDLALLDGIFKQYDCVEASLIPLLQKAQDIYGYLPPSVIKCVASHLHLSDAAVFGVITFYSQFHMNPRGKHIIKVCQGTACHVRGGAAVLKSISDSLGVKPGETTAGLEFTLETVACIGACGLAPVINIDSNTHGRLTANEVPAILKQYNN